MNSLVQAGLAQRFAVPMIALSSLLISVNGLLLRSIDSASQWQVIYARQASFVLALMLVLGLQYRLKLPRMIRDVGWPGVFGGISLAGANTGFIFAMSHTTVASTLFTLSSAPLMTAVLAAVFLKERIVRVTLIAITVAMAGIAVMVWDGLSGGSVIGNLLALACALCFSLFVIFLRLGKDRNMLPTSIIGATLGVMVGLLGSGFDFALSARDFGICFGWGAGVVSLVHILFTAASRYVPSAEIMLLTLIEFTLGPIWVWLAYDETPRPMALAGGLVVLSAVAGRTLIMLLTHRKDALPTPP